MGSPQTPTCWHQVTTPWSLRHRCSCCVWLCCHASVRRRWHVAPRTVHGHVAFPPRRVCLECRRWWRCGQRGGHQSRLTESWSQWLPCTTEAAASPQPEAAGRCHVRVVQHHHGHRFTDVVCQPWPSWSLVHLPPPPQPPWRCLCFCRRCGNGICFIAYGCARGHGDFCSAYTASRRLHLAPSPASCQHAWCRGSWPATSTAARHQLLRGGGVVRAVHAGVQLRSHVAPGLQPPAPPVCVEAHL